MPAKGTLPIIFLDGEWFVSGRCPKQILSQKFATVLSDKDFADGACRVVKGLISRPRMPASMKASGTSEWKCANGEFQISIELDEFKMGDLSVKRKGRYIKIHGKHAEKRDQHGLVSREFCRQFMLPNYCDIGAVASIFSPDHHKLTITAPVIEEKLGVYDQLVRLPLHEREYDLSSTKIEQKEFKEMQESCQGLYDELLQTDLMKIELETYLSGLDSGKIDLVELKRWYSQKKKEMEPFETEDVKIQEQIEIMDSIVQETLGMFLVDTGSPKAPVAASGTGSPKAPVAASGTGSPKAPVAASGTGSPKAPVAASGTGSPKAPVAASGTGSPKAPVEPKAVETGKFIQQ